MRKGISSLPVGWTWTRLEDIADVIDPQPDHRTPPEAEGGIPYLGVNNFLPDGSIDAESCRKVPVEVLLEQRRRFTVDEGAIVFGKIGTIANPRLLPVDGPEYALSANVVLIKPKIHPYLVLALLRSEIVGKQIASRLHTTSQPAFGIKMIRNLNLPLPPKTEQAAIANVLQTWDETIQTVEHSLRAMRERKRGLKQVLLTGKKRFMEFQDLPRPRVSLGSQIDRIVGGGTPSRSEPSYWDSTGIPWITVKDLKREVIWDTEEHISERGLRKSSATLIPAGTVIVATRMAVGKSVRCQVPAAINQDLKALFPKTTLRSDYLHLVLQASRQSLEAIASGSTVKGIRLADLRGLTFELPPVEEQAKISAALSVAEKEIGTVERQLEAYRLQKRGLMQQLLTGKKRINVDVPEAVPA